VKKLGWTLLVLVMLVGFGFSVYLYNVEKEYVGTVVDKAIKRVGNKDQYMIYVKLKNGKSIVFKNVDSSVLRVWDWKFNSSDLYALILKGRTYKFRVYGLRSTACSCYENIVDVKKGPIYVKNFKIRGL